MKSLRIEVSAEPFLLQALRENVFPHPFQCPKAAQRPIAPSHPSPTSASDFTSLFRTFLSLFLTCRDKLLWVHLNNPGYSSCLEVSWLANIIWFASLIPHFCKIHFFMSCGILTWHLWRLWLCLASWACRTVVDPSLSASAGLVEIEIGEIVHSWDELKLVITWPISLV